MAICNAAGTSIQKESDEIIAKKGKVCAHKA